jgi:hypothetical protein
MERAGVEKGVDKRRRGKEEEELRGRRKEQDGRRKC